MGLAIANTIASLFILASASTGRARGAGEADEQVGAVDHVGGRSRALLAVGDLGIPALDGAHACRRGNPRADVRERAARVGADDVAHAGLQHDLRHGDAGGAEADHEHFQLREAAAGELDGVQQRGHHDHGRAVLVVVEDGNVKVVLEPLLDLEAARRGDVLEVDPAEGGRDQLDGAARSHPCPSCRGRSGRRPRRRTP